VANILANRLSGRNKTARRRRADELSSSAAAERRVKKKLAVAARRDRRRPLSETHHTSYSVGRGSLCERQTVMKRTVFKKIFVSRFRRFCDNVSVICFINSELLQNNAVAKLKNYYISTMCL